MFWTLFVIVGQSPAIAATIIGTVLRFVLRGRAPTFQFAVWSFAITAAAYAGWQAWLFSREARDVPTYVTGSIMILAIPAFACAVGAFGFCLGWGGAAAVVETRRFRAGSTRAAPALARAAGPALLAIVAVAHACFNAQPSSYDRAQAAAGDSTRVDAMFRDGLARNDAAVLQDVGSLPTLPATTVAALATHASPLVRWKAATRSDLPPDLLLRLAADEDEAVRAAVAVNSAAADDALRAVIAAGGTNAPRLAKSALETRDATTRPATQP